MTKIPAHLQALLLVALASLAAPVAAQETVDPAPVSDAIAESTLDANPPTDTDTLAGDEIQPDPRCLRHTGSRVTADATARTVSGRLDARARIRCAHAPGTAYDRAEIDRTGATNIKEALERLDPRVF